jgi:phosphoglycerate kinase
MAIQFIDEADISGKRVLARFDFNVPLKDGVITDTTRVDRALKTINYILEHEAKTLVLMSHLGRPKGKHQAKDSLEPVATYLAEKLGQDVVLTESCVDRGIRTLLELPQTKIVLLENLRFHPEETSNDTEFARTLSTYGDLYVNDAFGAAHREHASTYEINRYFPRKAYGGFLMKDEVNALNKIVEKPKTPFIAIVGGAKVADKIKVIDSLLVKVQHLLIGGAMAYPFLKAKGHDIGTSLCSDEDLTLAKKILSSQSKEKVILPIDHITAKEFAGSPNLCPTTDIAEDEMGLDIGPQTIANYESYIAKAKTVLWNGPMGIFEHTGFEKGTFAITKALADNKTAYTLVGGGDSVAAVNKSEQQDQMGHVSTGGGASLEYIEKGQLPGVQALRFGLS